MWHVGREQVVSVDGQRYKLSRFTRALVRDWLCWADTQIPDTLAGLTALVERLPPDLAIEVVASAVRTLEPRKSLASRSVARLWATAEGIRYALALCLMKHQPELTEGERLEVVALLAAHQGDGLLVDLLVRAQGRNILSESATEVDYMREVGLMQQPGDSTSSVREDWKATDHSLAEVGLTPPQIDDLTLPELAAMCGGEDAATDPDAYIEAYRKLTPSQKLEMERRKMF